MYGREALQVGSRFEGAHPALAGLALQELPDEPGGGSLISTRLHEDVDDGAVLNPRHDARATCAL